ncbi:hypothetical protein BGX29_007696 [Mortierella sp. GBA35]|nr:hypothetical protein BGX29_007696 [Mortierella sp. GBA35]
MTTLQSHSTFIASSNSDDSVIISTTLSLNDHQTIAAIDLFHYPESDFKDSNRHRAYLGQKSRQRATRNFVWRKIQQGAVNQKDKERIERKLEQRRNKYSDSDESDSAEENTNNKNDRNDRYLEDDFSDSDDEGKDVEDEDEVVAREPKKQQHNAKHSNKKSTRKSTSSTESDRKAPLGLDTQQQQQRRSNKRADRRRRPEDEFFEVEHSNDEDTPSLSSTSSPPVSSSDNDEDDNEADNRSTASGDNFIIDGEEERIRFKHNLTFKSDDESAMSAPRIDLRAWKRAFVQRLDELDQSRSDSKQQQQQQTGKQRQKQKKNKGRQHYF